MSLESTIEIRGTEYVVREMTGKEANEVKKRIATGKPIDSWIAFTTLVSPAHGPSLEKFEDETPNFVIASIVRQAMKLSYPEVVDPKNA